MCPNDNEQRPRTYGYVLKYNCVLYKKIDKQKPQVN